MLAGAVEPAQLGAFLMLLRYRGEDVEEIAELVTAARAHAGLPRDVGAALDWPSYAAGRTRQAPWFVLAALALARAGVAVLMHGSNDFAAGIATEAALAALGVAASDDFAHAGAALRRDRFAYLPMRTLSPRLAELLALRRLFGLRSPVNTVVRLLNPGGAPASVDGVFHPAYLAVHLGVAERLGQPRLLVLKGGGGEAERRGDKASQAHLWDAGVGQRVLDLPALGGDGETEAAPSLDMLAAVWRGEAAGAPMRTVRATIALGLLAAGRARSVAVADAAASTVWDARR